MARSVWKGVPTSQKSLNYFIVTTVKDSIPELRFLSRRVVLTKTHLKNCYWVYQGHMNVRIRITPYHLLKKAGSYTTTRKPFYFRSKKK